MAKFTIEQVIENIRTRSTNAEGKSSLEHVSDRSIRESLEPFLPLIGDEVTVEDFVTKYALAGVDSYNRNSMHNVSEIYKNNDVTPKSQKTPPKQTPPVEFDMDAFLAKMQETQRAAVDAAVKPLMDKVSFLENERSLKMRTESVSALIDKDFKLSKNWKVDMDMSVRMAELKLGPSATAEQVYEEAKTQFNNTLSARGETYKPLDQTDVPGGSDFKDIKAMLEAKKK